MSDLTVAWVPDGDPCPKHPTEKSRVFHMPGVGLYSQCAECREEFLAWFSWSVKQRSVPLPLVPRKEAAAPPPQLHLIEETRP